MNSSDGQQIRDCDFPIPTDIMHNTFVPFLEHLRRTNHALVDRCDGQTIKVCVRYVYVPCVEIM